MSRSRANRNRSRKHRKNRAVKTSENSVELTTEETLKKEGLVSGVSTEESIIEEVVKEDSYKNLIENSIGDDEENQTQNTQDESLLQPKEKILLNESSIREISSQVIADLLSNNKSITNMSKQKEVEVSRLSDFLDVSTLKDQGKGESQEHYDAQQGAVTEEVSELPKNEETEGPKYKPYAIDMEVEGKESSMIITEDKVECGTTFNDSNEELVDTGFLNVPKSNRKKSVYFSGVVLGAVVTSVVGYMLYKKRKKVKSTG